MPNLVRNFGVGNIFLTPSVTNPTPIRFGTLQGASVDFSWDQKELYGQNQFPEAIGRGKAKLTGKATFGSFDGAMLTSLLTGATSATGNRIGVINESTGSITGGTYTAANATGFQDEGVLDENSKPLACVASAPAAGQYSVSTAGVYTFNTAANTKTYKVSYSYSSSSAGQTVTYTNQLMGSGNTYRLDLYNTEPDGTKIGLTLFAVTIPKLSLPFKNEDFTISDVDFSACADSSGNVFAAYLP